jgi:hypothetical protein
VEHKRFTSAAVAVAFFAAGYVEFSPFRVDYSPDIGKPAISRSDFFTQVQGTSSSTGVVLDYVRDVLVPRHLDFSEYKVVWERHK